MQRGDANGRLIISRIVQFIEEMSLFTMVARMFKFQIPSTKVAIGMRRLKTHFFQQIHALQESVCHSPKYSS